MKKIVIIGGGIAGLSAGIYARKAGYDVDIYEKNSLAGGQCMGWNRKQHHIDNCIHWLTGTKETSGLRKVWEDIGALNPNNEFVQNEVFYTSKVGEESATLWKDLDRTKRELLLLAPEDRIEINKFIKHVEYAKCCDVPVEMPMDFMKLYDYYKLGKSMSGMPKVMKEYGKISIEDLAKRFTHPVLKTLMSDYMPKEYQASAFIVSYATVVSGNGEVPKEGSLAMTNRIIAKFKELGGRLYCNSNVRRVVIKDKNAVGIELSKDSRIVDADYVISATDTSEMFTNLIGKNYMNKKWRTSYGDEQKYPLISGFQVAYSIDKDLFHYFDTVFFDCEPFQINNKSFNRMSVKPYQYEPDFAPDGKIVLQMNIAQYDDDYRYWKAMNEEEYQNTKSELAEVIKNRLIGQFPDLQNHIELLDCWTPLTYERYCNSYHGAYMSFITRKDVKSFHVKGTIDGLSNVFIASQWIMAPGGLPVAAAAGKFAVQRMLKREKRSYKI